MGSDVPENVIEWLTGQDRIALTLSQKRFINKVQKLKQKYPDQVDIIAENDDGSIYATMPLSALRLTIAVMSDSEAAQKARMRFVGHNNGE